MSLYVYFYDKHHRPDHIVQLDRPALSYHQHLYSEVLSMVYKGGKVTCHHHFTLQDFWKHLCNGTVKTKQSSKRENYSSSQNFQRMISCTFHTFKPIVSQMLHSDAFVQYVRYLVMNKLELWLNYVKNVQNFRLICPAKFILKPTFEKCLVFKCGFISDQKLIIKAH